MNPSFQGEMMLAGWNESHNGGVKLTFWLPDASELEAFKSMTVKKGNTAGQRLAVVMVEIGEDEKPVTKTVEPQQVTPRREPNRLAQDMMINGYFRNPKLWKAMDEAGIYTQAEHKAFIESQPCCGSRLIPMSCSGDVVLHHVRTAANSGTGIKPPHWFGVPVCHSHHTHVHGSNSSRAEKDALTIEAIDLTSNAIRRAMRKHLGIESMSEITAAMLTQFELEIAL